MAGLLRSIMTAARPSVRVDIVSDTVWCVACTSIANGCRDQHTLASPWCYVGKKHLEAAMARLDGQIDVDVAWHPFQLNPDATRENKLAMYNRKFGPDRVSTMIPMMQVLLAATHASSQCPHRSALQTWA